MKKEVVRLYRGHFSEDLTQSLGAPDKAKARSMLRARGKSRGLTLSKVEDLGVEFTPAQESAEDRLGHAIFGTRPESEQHLPDDYDRWKPK